jgi:hypothetical protein
MLAILVSIGPALGSPTILRRPLAEVPPHLRERSRAILPFFAG